MLDFTVISPKRFFNEVSLAAPGRTPRAAADRRAPNPVPAPASGVVHKRRRHDSIDYRQRAPLEW